MCTFDTENWHDLADKEGYGGRRGQATHVLTGRGPYPKPPFSHGTTLPSPLAAPIRASQPPVKFLPEYRSGYYGSISLVSRDGAIVAICAA